MRVGQRRAGRETFGGVAGESRHPRFLLDTLGQDLRFAGRQIARWPGFALLVVATLAVGIGANVAIFSVLEGVVFRPLPYSEPERLLAVWETPPRSAGISPSALPTTWTSGSRAGPWRRSGCSGPAGSTWPAGAVRSGSGERGAGPA